MKTKPRSKYKMNGNVRAWVCSCCGAPYCDPIYLSNKTYAGRKINNRLNLGVCIGCGRKPCKCKNKGRR